MCFIGSFPLCRTVTGLDMAPVMVLSNGLSSQTCVQAAYRCGQWPSKTCCMQRDWGFGNISKAFASSASLLSEERRSQSQFTSKALQSRRRQKHASLWRSVKVELATDADKGNVIDVADAELMEQYLAEAGEKLVVVDISTSTCGPCKLIFPKVVKMSEDYPEALFLKINGDSNNGTRALMRKWGVKAVPNFRFFKSGKLIHSHVGAKEDELRAHFLTHFTANLNVNA